MLLNGTSKLQPSVELLTCGRRFSSHLHACGSTSSVTRGEGQSHFHCEQKPSQEFCIQIFFSFSQNPAVEMHVLVLNVAITNQETQKMLIWHSIPQWHEWLKLPGLKEYLLSQSPKLAESIPQCKCRSVNAVIGQGCYGYYLDPDSKADRRQQTIGHPNFNGRSKKTNKSTHNSNKKQNTMGFSICS